MCDSGIGVPLDEAPYRVAAKRVTAGPGEHRVVGSASSLCEVLAEHADAAAGQGRGSVFPALSGARNVRADAEVNVSLAQSDEFGDA